MFFFRQLKRKNEKLKKRLPGSYSPCYFQSPRWGTGDFMKFEFSVTTEQRTHFINIDHLVYEAVKNSRVKNGICSIFVPHTTAAVTINENADPDVIRDILMEFEKIVPSHDNYTHMEGNSAAHIKTSLIGCSETILIENGRPQLGTWQSLFFCEFDGPRTRKLWLFIISEKNFS